MEGTRSASPSTLREESQRFPSWDLTARQICDLELLMNGSFAPLTGFLTRADYDPVLAEMRLADSSLWPIPVVLDVTEDFAARVECGDRVALRDPEGVMLAVLTVEDRWRPNREEEAQAVYGTADPFHPGVNALLHATHPVYLGGPVTAVEMPSHADFISLRRSPLEVRDLIHKWGWRRVVAFQTRNPMHRAHVELTHRAAQIADAKLLVHPVVGLTKPGDVDHYTRVRCYERAMRNYPEGSALLSLLPLSMRMAGPREALWHALIRRNYGCTHFIVGRDHAGPGKDQGGRDYYDPYAAQELVARHQDEAGIAMVPFQEMVYVNERAEYVPMDDVRPGEKVLSLSGTELRRRLTRGVEIPAWFSYPEVVEELRRTYPLRSEQGVTVFFTGLSGAGKSTIARVLLSKLMEIGSRTVTLLDGDLVRKNLSSELGFSREHRDLNILRIGYVASEITKHGGIALCAPIAPYTETRRKVREMVSSCGGFLEVYVATPLATCEERDRKGLYAKARAGLIKEFTGISDPYQAPENAELVIDTREMTPLEAAEAILTRLESEGYVR